MKYIWQYKDWTHFFWQAETILEPLGAARRKQGMLLGKADSFDLKETAILLSSEAKSTAEIEGERPNPDSIRSSVAKRLGLPTAGLPTPVRETDGLVEMLIDCTRGYSESLSKEILWSWQAALFPTGYSGLKKVDVGKWRSSATPMQVISGSMGKERVHYEAPPSDSLTHEMERFIHWWNQGSLAIDGILRAATAHIYFVTIHPFDDGNGRIARALTDRALAQDEKTGKRLYSLSSQIIEEKSSYYTILEETQKGKGDITHWLHWFLEMYNRSMDKALVVIEGSLFREKFYKKIRSLDLYPRQLKVISKLLDLYPQDFMGGVTNKKYVSMTKVSSETAKRDLKHLFLKGILYKNPAGGRSTSYRLNQDFVNQ